MQTSFLTLGGWDWDDYNGNITWFPARSTWNQTLTGLKVDDVNVIRDYADVNVMFEIGYPYIGLSNTYFNDISDILKQKVPEMECVNGKHWGLCRIPDKKCEDVYLLSKLTITMNEYEFTIPLENIAVYANDTRNHTEKFYCQT